jgi:iron complex transport system substrate-binding protein
MVWLFVNHAIAAIVVTDDAQIRVELHQPAKRIATLAPFLTELVYAADAGKQLVGVSAFSDYPPAAKSVPVVADYQGVAVESLLTTKPDLVLAWQTGNRPQDIVRLKALGIPVVQFELKTLADIPRAISQIALLAGISEQPKAVTDFNLRLSNLTKKVGEAQQNQLNPQAVRYFLPIERMPLMTLSGAHIVSKALAVCGGENIFANAAALAPVVDKEGIVAGNPEIIFVSAATAGRDALRVPLGDGFSALPVAAIKNKQIFGLNADWLMRPTPRMLGAVESACAAMNLVRDARKLSVK